MSAIPTAFEARIVYPETGCWEWTGGLTTGGYGRVKVRGRVRPIHRVMFEQVRGPIPEGLELDHLCRNRRCVNPEHLEPVTHRENQLRGQTFVAENARKTHCPKGHPYDDENTIWGKHAGGRLGRECRECKRQKQRESYAEGRRAE